MVESNLKKKQEANYELMKDKCADYNVKIVDSYVCVEYSIRVWLRFIIIGYVLNMNFVLHERIKTIIFRYLFKSNSVWIDIKCIRKKILIKPAVDCTVLNYSGNKQLLSFIERELENG